MSEEPQRGEAVGAARPTDEEWLGAFRRAVEVQERIFAEHEGIAARTRYEGVGEGGDNTLLIDRLCEDAIFAELEQLHESGYEFTVVSEERGTVSFGDGSAELRVVCDPIDGSLNARRTIPCHSVSIAVASGDSMDDVRLGYVYEFGAGEEFVGIAGEGATLDGSPLAASDGDGLELVALEASKPERMMAAVEGLAGRAYRIRSPGSIAVALCYVAANRYDGMLSTRNTRSVDAAAGQLIVREAAAEVGFAGLSLGETPLDLASRYHVAAARTAADLRILLEAQDRIP